MVRRNRIANWQRSNGGLALGVLRPVASPCWAMICIVTSHFVRRESKQMNFLLVCKPDSHALLYQWVADFSRTGEVRTVEKNRWNGKQRLTERYRYINQVPLRDSDDALLVNGCEVTITTAKQELVYRNAWATSHAIDENNVVHIVAATRARWKVENENNNVLKNHGSLQAKFLRKLAYATSIYPF
jgi:hypothetical protein